MCLNSRKRANSANSFELHCASFSLMSIGGGNLYLANCALSFLITVFDVRRERLSTSQKFEKMSTVTRQSSLSNVKMSQAIFIQGLSGTSCDMSISLHRSAYFALTDKVLDLGVHAWPENIITCSTQTSFYFYMRFVDPGKHVLSHTDGVSEFCLRRR